jgi:hypothetical protein
VATAKVAVAGPFLRSSTRSGPAIRSTPAILRVRSTPAAMRPKAPRSTLRGYSRLPPDWSHPGLEHAGQPAARQGIRVRASDCQQVVSSDPIRGLALHHGGSCLKLSEQY